VGRTVSDLLRRSRTNTRAFWSIANARRIIGYDPEDDSEGYAADIQRLLIGPAHKGRWANSALNEPGNSVDP